MAGEHDGPGSDAQEVVRGGHFYPQGPREEVRWADKEEVVVRGKGALLQAQWPLFSLAAEARSLGLERCVCVGGGLGLLRREEG